MYQSGNCIDASSAYSLIASNGVNYIGGAISCSGELKLTNCIFKNNNDIINDIDKHCSEETPADETSKEEKKERKTDRPKTDRTARANVWQGQPKQNKGAMTFEEMMAQFKQVSDEKMTDLKRNSEAKHSGGYSRRGRNN